MFTICLNSSGTIVAVIIWEHLGGRTKMNNAAENRRKKALLIVNPCAGKNRTRSDLGEIINAFPDGVFDFTIKYLSLIHI